MPASATTPAAGLTNSTTNKPIGPAPSLSELDLSGAERLAIEHGLPAFRGRQLYHALARKAIQEVRDLGVLPREVRESLGARFRTRTVTPKVHLRSSRDGAEKVLFGLHDGTAVETVLIRGGPAGRRTTVCVSSQVGCPAGCTFCATGLAGFARNLTSAEISDQVMYFAHRLAAEDQRVTNVVFMGMGEPLLNVRGVRGAVASLTDPAGFNLGERRITVSTVGITPQLRKFADWAGQVNLAVSLHAPSDELRSRLVPYNDRFPIADILEAVRDYTTRSRRRVSIEYVLLRGVNDVPSQADELADILRPLGGMVHVNLIPWNPFREGTYLRSEGPDADAFALRLRRGGINATIRYSKGLDISAACGQLREQLRDAV